MKKIKKLIKKYKTPLFIYKKKKIIKNIRDLNISSKIKIFYAIKANYNKEIIKILASKNVNFETVSIGEIKYLINIGIKPKSILISGVCKSIKDINYILNNKVGYVNIDSYEELKRFKNSKIKKILKFNLNIKTKTIKQIRTCDEKTKFGISIKYINKISNYLTKNKIKIYAVGFHLGSQVNKSDYYLAFKKLLLILKFFNKKNILIKNINIGGGFKFDYLKRKNLNYKSVLRKICSYNFNNVLIEPGRYIVANTCLTISKLEYVKKNKKINFAIVDVGMESLLRICLYNCYHKIKRISIKDKYHVVGPICESTDLIGKNIILDLNRNIYISIYDTGAYCTSMYMNYNMRKKPVEIII